MAQLQPIDIVAPGRFGLNTERESTLLAPEWATSALNAVVNRSGRLAARKGWANQTSGPIASTPLIDTLHEYLNESGTSVIISAADNKVYKEITDFTDADNDITSSTAPTDDHWQFINFNNLVLGYQRGHVPIQWNGTGDFTDQSFTGTGPDGNAACAAFGRVWAADADLQTVRYSALLDHDDFSVGNGGGTLDMSSIWTLGIDEIVAIAAVGANLVVFGKNHIVIWADGSGSELGIDPDQMEVVDTIEGTGCIARDSVVATGEGDLLYLSRIGVQSLSRVIQSKSNPLVTISKHVRSAMVTAIETSRASDTQMDQVRAVHSPEKGLYLINFPVIGTMYAFDTQHPFQDEDGEVMFPVTKWQVGGDIRGLEVTTTGDIYFGSEGVVGLYSGNIDNTSPYDFEVMTGWLDFGELNHRLKILKELIATISVSSSTTLIWVWEWDFSGIRLTRSAQYNTGDGAEFNVAEFNEDEFAGAVTISRRALPAHGEGQFIRVGVTASINSFDVVLQQISLSPKIGRMVT